MPMTVAASSLGLWPVVGKRMPLYKEKELHRWFGARRSLNFRAGATKGNLKRLLYMKSASCTLL